jgi:hypothetical protein
VVHKNSMRQWNQSDNCETITLEAASVYEAAMEFFGVSGATFPRRSRAGDHFRSAANLAAARKLAEWAKKKRNFT